MGVVFIVAVAVRGVCGIAAPRAGAAAGASAGDNVSGNKCQYGAQYREASGTVALDLHNKQACFGRALDAVFVSLRDVGGLQDMHVFRFIGGVGNILQWGTHCTTIPFKNVRWIRPGTSACLEQSKWIRTVWFLSAEPGNISGKITPVHPYKSSNSFSILATCLSGAWGPTTAGIHV